MSSTEAVNITFIHKENYNRQKGRQTGKIVTTWGNPGAPTCRLWLLKPMERCACDNFTRSKYIDQGQQTSHSLQTIESIDSMRFSCKIMALIEKKMVHVEVMFSTHSFLRSFLWEEVFITKPNAILLLGFGRPNKRIVNHFLFELNWNKFFRKPSGHRHFETYEKFVTVLLTCRTLITSTD